MEGLSPANQDAIVKLIDEKVDEIKTGHKQPTQVDHDVYEGLAVLFKEDSEEKKPKSDNKKPAKHVDNANYEGLPELFKSSEEKPTKKNSSNNWETEEEESLNSQQSDEESNDSEDFYKNKEEKRPFHFILNPAFNMWHTNYLSNLFNQPNQDNLAVVPYNPHQNLYNKFFEQLADIKKFAPFQPTGAEKECQSFHRDIFRSYFTQLVIENQLQNVKIFDENIIQCNFIGENQDRIDTVLQFNGETCYLSVAYSKPQNSEPVYSILNDAKAKDQSTLKIDGKENCLQRFGTTHAKAM